MNKSNMPGTDYKDISTVRGEGQWQAMGRFTKRHCYLRASICEAWLQATWYHSAWLFVWEHNIPVVIITTTIPKRTEVVSQHPLTKKISLLLSFLTNSSNAHREYLWFPFFSKSSNCIIISFSLREFQGAQPWSEWLFLITPNTDVLS